MACGALLVAGFLTPLAGLLGSLARLGQLGLAWTLAGAPGSVAVPPALVSGSVTALALVVTIAIVLLGPGALSIDAHLFGRREIVIPPDRRPSA